MKLIRYEIRLGLFKGLALGIRHYPFEDEDMYEEDVVIMIGIFQIIITKIYQKEI